MTIDQERRDNSLLEARLDKIEVSQAIIASSLENHIEREEKFWDKMENNIQCIKKEIVEFKIDESNKISTISNEIFQMKDRANTIYSTLAKVGAFASVVIGVIYTIFKDSLHFG